MSANETQVGGSHYKERPVQAWDFIHRNGIGFLAGNVIKYLVRHREKGGVVDLRKAKHYLEKLIEEEELAAAGVAALGCSCHKPGLFGHLDTCNVVIKALRG